MEDRCSYRIGAERRSLRFATPYEIFYGQEENTMSKKIQTGKASDDYLKTLEAVKKQYRQYVEVSELYKLPIQKEEETIQYYPPSPERPLTTNRILIKQ